MVQPAAPVRSSRGVTRGATATPSRGGNVPRPRRAAPVMHVLQRAFDADTPEYFLLFGTTLFLVVFGWVMVLSSSSVTSYVDDGDFFAKARNQGLYALIGLPVMLLAARAPMRFWRRWANWAIGVALALQLLVVATPLGSGDYNRNWIQFGSFTFQPSELVKLALIIWLPSVLVNRFDRIDDWRKLIIPLAPVALGSILLVMLGNDLGTAIILFAIVVGALYLAGMRLRHLVTFVLGAGLLGMIAVLASASRRGRFELWLSGCSNPTPEQLSDGCWQSIQGWGALAHGGILGVGLGNSSGKWLWLPESDNDFIFAIIGEELGMVGAILVLLLFVFLTVAFVRVARMARDPYAKIATGTAMVWIVGQGLVNIGVVLGLLPVLGVPLPLVSAGGTSLITSLAAIGIVLSFARHKTVVAPSQAFVAAPAAAAVHRVRSSATLPR